MLFNSISPGSKRIFAILPIRRKQLPPKKRGFYNSNSMDECFYKKNSLHLRVWFTWRGDAIQFLDLSRVIAFWTVGVRQNGSRGRLEFTIDSICLINSRIIFSIDSLLESYVICDTWHVYAWKQVLLDIPHRNKMYREFQSKSLPLKFCFYLIFFCYQPVSREES
jgi:hypothetical protein